MTPLPRALAFARDLGKLLEEQRNRQGLTQEELSERAKLSRRHVGDVERGQGNPTLDVIERLARSLDWNPWELLRKGEQPIADSVYPLLLAALEQSRDQLVATITWLKELHPLDTAKGESGDADAS